MKKLFIIMFACLMSSVGISKAQEDAGKIKGYWLTEEGTSQVYIYKAKNGNYYGKICWLEEPNEDGAPKKDKENPDDKLKERPIMDLLLLQKFSYNEKEKEWENGTIYDPKSGKTYDCFMWFENGDFNTLKIKGYVMGMRFIGREATWKREENKR